MSSPLLRELLATCRQASGLTQKLISHNTQRMGQVYRQYGPKSAVATYLVCGLPTGAYVGHSFYKYNTKTEYYHSPGLPDFILGSIGAAVAGALTTTVWPLVSLGAIGHYRQNRKENKSKDR
jgi:ABC-type Fe3+ transport system permease subunit